MLLLWILRMSREKYMICVHLFGLICVANFYYCFYLLLIKQPLTLNHPIKISWMKVAPIKKSPPMGLRADSFECDVSRLIWGL
jgi:hypothetical protein